MIERGLLFIILTVLCLSGPRAEAQFLEDGDPAERYMRLLTLSGQAGQTAFPSFLLRPVDTQGFSAESTGAHPWSARFGESGVGEAYNAQSGDGTVSVRLYNPSLTTTFNSAVAFGYNDGAMWQGRGVNQEVSAGVKTGYGPLRISLRPRVGYSQNRAFELSPFEPHPELSEFAPPFSRRYDAPQRFGDELYSWFSPGQSYARLQAGGFAAGVSTENLWTGSAIHNPILFSYNAPGFLHAFVGTRRPVQTPVGAFEGRMVWGGLRESDWFDEDPGNDLRYVNALSLVYSPSFIPGLHLGASRTYLLIWPEQGLEFSDYYRVLIPFTKDNFISEENPGGNDEGYQMIALSARWAHPASGFEIYGEWSRNDHARDTRDLQAHLTHARGFVLGLLKRFDLSASRMVAVNLETTQLEAERGGHPDYRSAGTYYTNNTVIQGFTHRGQLMGASIGPGANSYIGRVDWYEPWGMAGVSFTHVSYQADRLDRNYSQIVEAQPGSPPITDIRELENRIGLHGVVFLPRRLELQGDLYMSRFMNRYNIRGDDFWNLNLAVTVRYQLDGGLR